MDGWDGSVVWGGMRLRWAVEGKAHAAAACLTAACTAKGRLGGGFIGSKAEISIAPYLRNRLTRCSRPVGYPSAMDGPPSAPVRAAHRNVMETCMLLCTVRLLKSVPPWAPAA